MLKTINVWSVDNVERLKGCFMCTYWEVFTQDNPDINTASDSMTDYIKFCTETVIPKKTVKCFPNNKPYITKEIKDCIHRKKLAFARRDRQEVKRVQKELNIKLREEKRQNGETFQLHEQ